MKALRVQVERVVRPLRASPLRKDRMREELLAHLTRLYEEELARTGDPQLATTDAIGRFGDAGSLTCELQASVPRLERWAYFSVPVGGPLRRRRGESPIRYVLRSNGWGLLFGVAGYALLAPGVAVLSSLRPYRIDQPTIGRLAVFFAAVAGLQVATMIIEALLSEGIRRELESRAAATTAVERRVATWSIVGYAVLSSAVLGAAFAGLMLLIEALLPFPLITRAQFWWIICGVVAIGLPLMLWQAFTWKARNRRFENWDSLDLDEQCSA